MGCSGFKLIGTIIGFLFYNFPGAIIGFFIGYLIDFLFSLGSKRSQRQYYSSKDFTEHELVLAAYVAKADNNRLLRSEMEYVRHFLSQNMSSNQVQSAMLRFRDILNSDINIQAVCKDIKTHATIYEKLIILQFLFGFSNADGLMNQDEVNAIQYISDLCGISRSNYEAIKSMFTNRYSNQYGGYSGGYGNYGGYGGQYDNSNNYTTRVASDDDYKILEVSPKATDDEVKKAYRAAAKKHHPDKVSHLGEDVRKAAEKKFAQVNEAYERIKKARGMN